MRLPILCLCLVAFSLPISAQPKFDYYESGLPQYRYELKSGSLEGEFVSYYDNGLTRAKGAFTHSQKTGLWLAWDSTGVLRTKRFYRNNEDYDVLSEWTTEGCAIDTASVKAAAAKSPVPAGGSTLAVNRYWKQYSADTVNEELFNGRFRTVLDSTIIAGKTTVFEDDRFVTPMDSTKASVMTAKERLGFVVKEERVLDDKNEHWFRRIIGLGLVYKDDTLAKTAWIYFNDFYYWLVKTADAGSITADKLKDDRFHGKIIMTTQGSPGSKPQPVDEKDIVRLTLEATDTETNAWIYLLDKRQQQ